MRAYNENNDEKYKCGDKKLRELLTDDSSTKIEGSFFSVAITTPLAAAIPNI